MDLSPGQLYFHSSFLPDPSALLSLLLGLSPDRSFCVTASEESKGSRGEEATDEDAQLPAEKEKAVGLKHVGSRPWLLCRGELLRTLTESQACLQAE